MQRLAVLVTTHLFPSERTQLSGPWLAEQVDTLAEHADTTVLAALRHCKSEDIVRTSGVKVKYRPTVVLPGQSRAALVAAAFRYARVARRVIGSLTLKPDVLHAHFGFPDAVVAAPIARDFSIPLIVTLHGDDAFYLMHRRDWLGRAIRNALASASAVICVSPSMYESVRPALPDSVRVEMIENGYDDHLFRLNDVTHPGGLLFVGTLTKVKNVDVLLRAYAHLEGIPDLTIAGDGPLRVSLERLAAELGISSRVSFVGEQSREQVATLMQNARALVLPSASEGYGLVAAEALASGTPVVASNTGGLPTILGSSAAGALVTPGSVEELARGISTVLAQALPPSSVAAASSAAGWSVRVRELLSLYSDVIENRGRR